MVGHVWSVVENGGFRDMEDTGICGGTLYTCANV